MKVAIVGCCHGTMSSLYASIEKTEKVYNVKVDLVIICGDFQSIRNETDLKCINCPDKYKTIGDFHKYYSGEILAPYMTVFIGGNHESSNYLNELYYGGWVCKNIYYMGCSGVVNINGLRIAGISGIYKDNDFDMGQFEKMPYNNNTIRSIYHIRKFNWQKLMQIEEPVDIMISHDWPTGIPFYGNYNNLIRRKEFFKQDMFSYNLGSTPNNDLLVHLKPSYWFSAHLHCKFAAIVHHDNLHHYFPTYLPENKPHFNIPANPVSSIHGQQANKKIKIDNPDEIVMEDSDHDEEHDINTAPTSNENSTNPDEILMEEEDSEEELKEDNHPSMNSSNNPEEIVIEDDDDDDNKGNDGNDNSKDDIKNSEDAAEEENKGMNEEKDIELSDNSSSDLKRKIDENSNKTEDSTLSHKTTKFLALDKCLPRRQFLQIIDIPTKSELTSPSTNNNHERKEGEGEGEGEDQTNEPSTYEEPQFSFEYDTEWLAITRAFSKYPLFESSNPVNIPSISQMKR